VFGPGIDVVLAVDFNKDGGTITSQGLLTGSQYTVITDSGQGPAFATTSLFAPVFNNPTCTVVSPTCQIVGFDANSQFPDLTTPNVILDPTKVVNASAADPNIGPQLAKCTPPYSTVFVKIKGKLVPEQVCPGGSISAGPD
jgi:hypothetical protein